MRNSILLLLLLLIGCAPIAPQVCTSDTCLAIERMTTPQQHAQGMMFRESLPKGEGMLFVFADSATRQFWMKNTLIPLDMIWMDENGKVIHVETARPCNDDPCPSYGPQDPARYVLETNAGWAWENGVGVGAQLMVR